MLIFYHKELINDFSLFIIWNLSEFKVALVVNVHDRVAVVLTVEGTPFRDFSFEGFASFFASCWTSYDVDWGAWIGVGLLVGSVVDLKL
jgi:hypothetical protein